MAVAATTPVLAGLDPRRCEVAMELIDEHFPLLLVRWSGQVQPQHVLRMIRFFDSNVQLAVAQQRSLVHICDARDAAMPGALVRDMLVDWLSDRPRSDEQTALRSYIVASDPMIRGVVASLKWATGRGDGLRVVPTLGQAIAGARKDFEDAGLPVPEILLAAA